MTQHTEGPWDMIPPNSNFPSRTISGPDSEGVRYRPLARVFEYDGLPNRTSQLTITPEEADANACLIIAAPQLLVALETLAAADMGEPTLHAEEYQRQVKEIAAAAVQLVTGG